MGLGAKLTHGPCIGGPLDGTQSRCGFIQFDVLDGGKTYRYLEHQLAGEISKFSFYSLEGVPIDHAISYLLRGYKKGEETCTS